MTDKQLIELTKQFIAIQSTADNPDGLSAAVDFVARFVAQQAEVTIERFSRNGRPSFLAYRGKIRPKKFDIILNAHVDVIPADSTQFHAYEKDGKLYGRGALDMKGTALVLADVFCELVNEVPYALGLQIVSDEEVGGYDGVKLQIESGVCADFVIMGEYANGRNAIYNAARGVCWAEIAFNGKTAHGGHLWNGTNAVVKASEFAAAVLQRYPTPDKETWTTTANIANLSTPNEVYNKVPDKAILKIDFRFTQEDPVFESKESFELFIHGIDPDATLVNLAPFEPAVKVTEMNPYVQGLSAALRQITDSKPRYLSRPGGSDGRHYALINNDTVEFGLYGGGSHSHAEYVELASFGEYQATLRHFLRQPLPTQLKKTIEKPQPLQEALLSKLVSMPTITADKKANQKALAFVANFLRERGMHLDTFEQNGFHSIIATTRPNNKRPAVLLNAHIDVVPADQEIFTLKLKNGRFYGRGVMDMKHAIASYLTAIDALKDELSNYDLGIMITSDEEVGSNDGVKPLVAMGYRPGVVIIPDGGNNWQLETFSKGVKWVQLKTEGKAAHASRPWEGESAVKKLLAAIHDIERLVPKNPKPTDTLLSVGTIEGGTTPNQIPIHASAILDIRTGSVVDHDRLNGQIRDICKTYGVTVTLLADEPPCVSNPEHPLIKPMIDIVEQVTGDRHGTMYDYAASDGRIFSAAGIPTIIINPECGGIHTDQEWLSRDSFAQFSKVIELYVRRMATSKSTTPELAQQFKPNHKPAYV